MSRRIRLIVLLAVCSLAALLVSPTISDEKAAKPQLARLPKRILAPKDNPTSGAKVELGRQLFFDARLSGDNTMSCATCHLPEKGFADGLSRSKGHKGKRLSRNTPGLLNVGLFSEYFWDGRARTLEEQALAPIENPDEMHENLDDLVKELNAVPTYVKEFQAVFGTNVTKDGIAKSLAAFQRTLVTGPSPFDRYLAGEKNALSARALRGLELFRGKAGCVRCHNGPLLSDGKYHRLGVSFRDKGRAAVTKKNTDLHKFRTPSLRNIAETGPYMHDGSLETLNDVVLFYYRNVPTSGPKNLPLDIAPLLDQSLNEADDIVEFLKSLSGKPPIVKVPKKP